MLKNNLSFYIAICYFSFYSITLSVLCYIFSNFITNTSNFYTLTQFLHYSKKKLFTFLVVLFSSLGIPPFCLFMPKFAGLTTVFYNSSWFFFFFTLSIAFFSFALYLQIFDGLFFKKYNHFLKQYFKNKHPNKSKYKRYKKNKIIFFFFITTFIGFFFFKDLILILNFFF